MSIMIGISTNRATPEGEPSRAFVSELYIQSIIRAGAVPVLVPNGLTKNQLAELRQWMDGIMLTGGGDIDPAFFQGKSHPRIYGIERVRDETEIAIIAVAVETNWPFLGICRGIQVINVARGGTLFTHIQDQKTGALKHDYFPNHPRDFLAHEVTVAADSNLFQILGAGKVMTNSLHHQGIDQVGKGLRVTAAAPDGLAEAVELEGHPFGLGVQWHPECMPESQQMQSVFRNFIEAAGRKN